SREKYLLRLLVFGGLMEIVLQMVEPGASANIFLTLASGFALLWCMEGKQPLCLAIAILGLILKVDYGWYGIVMIPVMYYCKDRLWILSGLLPVLTHAYIKTSWCADTQYYSVVAVLILMLYNGKKGYSSKFMKWFFYAYYPVHVAILASISMF
ncbi:MAG: hypothetical protein HUJ58_07930, partial [Erysipelotrichaceae bacterium]|nr:hypothetical protein [Erysipelotrichaceae bacterium]